MITLSDTHRSSYERFRDPIEPPAVVLRVWKPAPRDHEWPDDGADESSPPPAVSPCSSWFRFPRLIPKECSRPPRERVCESIQQASINNLGLLNHHVHSRLNFQYDSILYRGFAVAIAENYAHLDQLHPECDQIYNLIRNWILTKTKEKPIYQYLSSIFLFLIFLQPLRLWVPSTPKVQ